MDFGLRATAACQPPRRPTYVETTAPHQALSILAHSSWLSCLRTNLPEPDSRACRPGWLRNSVTEASCGGRIRSRSSTAVYACRREFRKNCLPGPPQARRESLRVAGSGLLDSGLL